MLGVEIYPERVLVYQNYFLNHLHSILNFYKKNIKNLKSLIFIFKITLNIFDFGFIMNQS